MKQQTLFIVKQQTLFIFGIVFVLALTKVFLTARLATTGVELAQIEVKSWQLVQKNSLLDQEIIERSSLTRIASEAARLGLMKSKNIVNLTLEVPVALHESR